MPREGSPTKEKLLRAGEQLFARDGIHGALTRDIVTAAGQANDSAIHYHFGSRPGLLAAILDKHVQQMEAERRAALELLGAQPRIATLVRVIVEPVADKLRTEDGRDFLRIIAQLAGRAEPGVDPEPLRGTALADQLNILARLCSDRLGETLAAERITLMITMLTAALADRARRIEARRRLVLEHDDYVADLIDVLAAGLRASSRSGASIARR